MSVVGCCLLDCRLLFVVCGLLFVGFRFEVYARWSLLVARCSFFFLFLVSCMWFVGRCLSFVVYRCVFTVCSWLLFVGR